MASWLPFDLKRRGFIGAGLLAVTTAALGGRQALSQAEQSTSHQGNQMPAAGSQSYEGGGHMNAHAR